jgi:hypothetical protein
MFTHIGYPNIVKWLNGTKVAYAIGSSAECATPTPAPDATSTPPYCYSGYTETYHITFYHTNMVNPVINMLHETGHLVDNVWALYFEQETKKKVFKNSQGEVIAGWDGEAYQKLELVNNFRKTALINSFYLGDDA